MAGPSTPSRTRRQLAPSKALPLDYFQSVFQAYADPVDEETGHEDGNCVCAKGVRHQHCQAGAHDDGAQPEASSRQL